MSYSINSDAFGKACISSVCYKESNFMDYRFTAYKAATELGFHVVRNPEDTGITQNIFTSSLKKDYPIFILLMGKVKSEAVMDECRLALEYGLPIFAFMKTDGPDIPAETSEIMKSINQFTYDSDCSTFINCEDLFKSIQNRLKQYINGRINMRPNIQINRGSTYAHAYEQIKAAKKRIVLSQKTSTLILGPRRGNDYEYRFYETLLKWIDDKTTDMQFMHLFDINETIKAFSESDYNLKEASDRLGKLIKRQRMKAEGREHPGFTFRAIQKECHSVSHIITDTGFQLVLPIAGETFNLVLPYYFATENELMKLVTHLNTCPYVPYSDVENMYVEYCEKKD